MKTSGDSGAFVGDVSSKVIASRRLPRVAAAMIAAACAAHASADADVFILAKRDAGIVIEKVHLADGASRQWSTGTDGFIDVVLPPGPGGSAGIVQSALKQTTTASCSGTQLSVVTTAGNQRFERPIPANLRSLDIHVSARRGDESTFAGFIRSYDRWEPDPVGVIEDPFGNAIPLQASDVVVYTTTFESRDPAAANVIGEVAVRFVGGHHLAHASVANGAAGEMVVDLAAGATVLAKRALPPGVQIQPSETVQYSAEGVKRLAAQVGGATDAVTPLGFVRLERLTLGTIVYTDVEALVFEELPPIADGVIGILGIDLMARSASVSIPYPKQDKPAVFRVGPGAPDASAISVPLSVLGSRAYCRASVNEAPVNMIIDTGSPVTILDDRAAAAAGVQAEAPPQQVRGIGSGRTSIRAGTARTLGLAGSILRDQPVQVGAIPLFARFKGSTPVGILGNGTLSHFARVEIDFARSQLRLFPAE